MLDQHLDHLNLFIYQDQEQEDISQVEVVEVALVLDQGDTGFNSTAGIRWRWRRNSRLV
jgi:hypothetical protein